MRYAPKIAAAAIALGTSIAAGQAPDGAAAATPSEPVTKPQIAEPWSLSLSNAIYLLPDHTSYVQATFTADKDWLHVETRYNYEALETGSAWLGYNLSFGEKLSLQLTPMLGGVFGDLNGVAPGYSFTLTYGPLELYSEGEYVFDLEESSGNFFYNWSELSLSPVPWFRFGMVVQRTRAYRSDLDIQRGALVGFTFENLSFTAYVFNPDEDTPTIVLSFEIDF